MFQQIHTEQHLKRERERESIQMSVRDINPKSEDGNSKQSIDIQTVRHTERERERKRERKKERKKESGNKKNRVM